MLRDVEDRLFAEEMALSTRHYKDAVARGIHPRLWASPYRRLAARARSRELIRQSVLLRDTARTVAAESAFILEKTVASPRGFEPRLPP
jgi:hypothetical protein